LEFAKETAFRAGRLVLATFQTGLAVETKTDGSPVTAADRAGEVLIRERIEKRFPRHGIFGEELGKSGPTEASSKHAGNSSNDSTHRWIVDPIDGTRSFVRGVPLFGVLLALEIDGEVVVGVCYLPALDEMIAAAKGEGCSWNGRPARVTEISRLDQALVSLTEPGSLDDGPTLERFWKKLKRSGATIRGYCDCYGHCLVATGRCDVMLDPVMNPWDCAALLPIVEEAGGTFTDWSGERTIYGGSAVSTNGQLFDRYLELIRE
jgi:myo-inositol-1(or 4)-monophosphatase